MKTLYLLLAIAGLLVSLVFAARLALQPGLSLGGLLGSVFSDPLVSLLGADLALSSLVFWVFVFRESQRRHIPYPWLYILANLVFGLCFALPLFLYVRHDSGRPKS